MRAFALEERDPRALCDGLGRVLPQRAGPRRPWRLAGASERLQKRTRRRRCRRRARQASVDTRRPEPVEVSFVLPCLDEVRSLEACITAIDAARAEILRRFGLRGEIVIADNGSVDGSQALAERLGARVVAVTEKGYGAALRGGLRRRAGAIW